MTQTPVTPTPAPHAAPQLTEITETIALAFATDPTWAPFLTPEVTDLAVARRYWGLFVNTAQRYPWTFTARATASVDAATGDHSVAAATVWYPPGAEELTPAEEAAFPEFAADLLGATKRDELLEVSDRFEAAHPSEPHYYLSLLATHPAHRGHGLGMGLLAANLAHLDDLGAPSYLESSNPANDRRYMALGYEPHGSIELPSGLKLTTFWRDPATR